MLASRVDSATPSWTASSAGPGSPMCWTGAALQREPKRWCHPLPASVALEVVQYHRAHPRAALDLEGFAFDPAALPRLTAYAAGLREPLLRGSGLVRIRGLHRLGLDPAQLRLTYLALGCGLGEPMTEYGRLYEVADRGGSHLEAAIPVSQTAAATGYHTDSSRHDCVPDLVGLLCEQPSAAGGESLVSNALAAHHLLRSRAPDALQILQQPFVRDLVTPGIEKTRAELLRNRFPVFSPAPEHAEGLLFRYMRYWIETGQDKAGAPLDAAAQHALDLLDLVLERQALSFRLGRGDVLFVNNRFLAHSRTGYRDHGTAGAGPRRLQRMWIRTDGGAATR